MGQKKNTGLNLRVTKTKRGSQKTASLDKGAVSATPALTQSSGQTVPAIDVYTCSSIEAESAAFKSESEAYHNQNSHDAVHSGYQSFWQPGTDDANLQQQAPRYLFLGELNLEIDNQRKGYVILSYHEASLEVDRRHIENEDRVRRGLSPREPKVTEPWVYDVNDPNPYRPVSAPLSWMVTYPAPDDPMLLRQWLELVHYQEECGSSTGLAQPDFMQTQSQQQTFVQSSNTLNNQQATLVLGRPSDFTNNGAASSTDPQVKSVQQQASSPPPKPQTYLGLQPYVATKFFSSVANLVWRPISIGSVNTKARERSKTVRASNYSRQMGTLYAFTRSSDPGFIKIGYTADSLHHRMMTIKSHCRFDPVLEVVFEDVPYPTRVEGLIHLELQARNVRRVEDVCRYGSGVDAGSSRKPCKGKHYEWFEMELHGDSGAEAVMERWVRWMKLAQPYDQQGKLQNAWAEALRLFTHFQGRVLTGKDACALMPGTQSGDEIAASVVVGAKRKLTRAEEKYRNDSVKAVRSKRALFQEVGGQADYLMYQPFCKEVYGYAHDTSSDGEESEDEGPEGQHDVCRGIW